jgi:hypothetical protein
VPRTSTEKGNHNQYWVSDHGKERIQEVTGKNRGRTWVRDITLTTWFLATDASARSHERRILKRVQTYLCITTNNVVFKIEMRTAVRYSIPSWH